MLRTLWYQPGVVDAHRGTVGQLDCQYCVVLVEGQGVAGAFEFQDAEHYSAGAQWHCQVGVDASAGQERGSLGIAGYAGQVPLVHMTYQDGFTGVDALRDQTVCGVGGQVAFLVADAGGLGGVGRGQGEGAEKFRAASQAGGAVTGQDGVEDVHRRDVGELGHGNLSQLAGGLVHVQHGADECRGISDQGQAPSGPGSLCLHPVPLGDIRDRGSHTLYLADGVLQPVEGDRPGIVLISIGPGSAGDVLVQQRDSRLQHPPLRGLDGSGLHMRQDL